MKKQHSEFVLGFICDNGGNRLGLRVCNLDTGVVSEIPVPRDSTYANLYIRGGTLSRKYVNLSDFPVFETVAGAPAKLKGPAAWVLKNIGDGRVQLISHTGQLKTVKLETALGYHRTYGIVGCSEVNGEFVVPEHDYTSEVDEAPSKEDVKPSASEEYLVKAFKAAVKALSKVDLRKEDIEVELGSYYSTVMARVYISAFVHTNYTIATSKLNDAVERINVKLKEKYPEVDVLSGETSGNGYCTLILGMNEPRESNKPEVKNYKAELMPAFADVMKYFTSTPVAEIDCSYEASSRFARLTANIRSAKYASMSHMAATDDLCGTVEYYEEKLQEKYPWLSIGCDVGEKGYYSVTISKAI